MTGKNIKDKSVPILRRWTICPVAYCCGVGKSRHYDWDGLLKNSKDGSRVVVQNIRNENEISVKKCSILLLYFPLFRLEPGTGD